MTIDALLGDLTTYTYIDILWHLKDFTTISLAMFFYCLLLATGHAANTKLYDSSYDFMSSSALRLSVEAVVFGAALFDAEVGMVDSE